MKDAAGTRREWIASCSASCKRRDRVGAVAASAVGLAGAEADQRNAAIGTNERIEMKGIVTITRVCVIDACALDVCWLVCRLYRW